MFICGSVSVSISVVLARNLSREGTTVDIVTLGEAWIDRVDMLTLVLIGSSQTRLVEIAGAVRVFTPRGYAAKSVSK